LVAFEKHTIGEEDDETCEKADAGASLTIPSEAGAVKKGG